MPLARRRHRDARRVNRLINSRISVYRSVCLFMSIRFAGRERTWQGTERPSFCLCLRIWHWRITSTTALSVRLSLRGGCAFVPFRSLTRASTSASCWPIWTVEQKITASSVSSVCIRYWLRGTVVERRPVTGELSLSYARSAADAWPLMWVNRLLQGQPTRSAKPFILSRSINE